MTKELDRLSQSLRDERVLREQADQRAARATEQAKIWRRRAEERVERIRELELAKRPLFGRRRQPERPNPLATAPPPTATPLTSKSHPTVRIAAATHECDDVLAMFDTLPFEGKPPTDSDLVVIDAASVERWSADQHRAFRKWADSPGRVPLVVTGAKGLPWRVDTISIPNDALRSFSPGRLERHLEPDLVRVEAADLNDVAIIADAASGTPLAVGGANPSVSQASVAARRWAYRHHHPHVKAARLLQTVGFDAPEQRQLVSAILVSNRPELVHDQIRVLCDQSYPDVEILVTLHGESLTDEIREAVDRASDTHRIVTAVLPGSLSLGQCLNETIESSSGDLLAKIDDDDFYGPAYVEDAVHAFDYSKADVVGKATQFTYMAEADETILRRPGQEDRVMNGSPTGASMLTTRRTWAEVRFPHRPRFVDSVFVRGARSIGATVYASSRWEFCYVRNASGHTWEASTDALLAGSEPAFPGFDAREVVVADGCSGLVAPTGS